MMMLLIEKYPVQVVANHYGVDRSTIWRWKQRWQVQNKHVSLRNEARRKSAETSTFRYASCTWSIPTLSAAPHHPHMLSEDLVQLVLDVRGQLNRCAEVVWYHINAVLCISISLSSVRRILKRNHRPRRARHHRNRQYKGIRRPKILAPGDLVEIDTIHLFNPVSKQKRYIYTVIDLYTRMAYARVYKELRPSYSLNTILEARQYFGFEFKMVQSDNGLEFAEYFASKLRTRNITLRHTRLGRPNDNAHIERFNRTLQEECTGSYYLESESLKIMDDKVLSYIDYYNYHRVHLGIGYRAPGQMLHRL